MIEYSNNSAATSLWNDVGGASGVAAFDALEGLSRVIWVHLHD